MTRRADEEFSRRQFDSFLATLGPRFATRCWEEPEHDPPDYLLHLADETFAVEVTSLVEQISVGVATKLPRWIVLHILESFVDSVEAVASEKGWLHGKYLVYFPTPIDDFAAVKESIEDGLLGYVRDTRDLDKDPGRTVLHRSIPGQRSQRCRIEKLGNERDRLLTGPLVWMKWEGEVLPTLGSLIEERLLDKRHKLRDVQEPTIILLLDRYRFADAEMYAKVLPDLAHLDSFHTVFAVLNEGKWLVLHSRETSWLAI